MPYIKSTCRAGRTKEIGKYYTKRYRPRGERRAPKEKQTSPQQKKVNDRQLERKLTRILNANFDESCWYLTFTYEIEKRPREPAELKKHKRRLLQKSGRHRRCRELNTWRQQKWGRGEPHISIWSLMTWT